jgi:hypothetical protein
MNIVKQSTAVILKLGPFVDSTDGVTAETGLTIAQGDIQISKAGAAFAQTSEGSPTTTHDADGWYPIPLTTGDTDTLGAIVVQVTMSGALPVFWRGMVVPAATYDSLVAGTDKLPVDAVEISGDSTAADNLEAACDGNAYNVGGGAVVAASVTAQVDLVDAPNATARTAFKDTMEGIGGHLDLIKAKTDNLPDDPADDGDIDTQLAAIAGYLDTEVAAIKAKTDLIPATPADEATLTTIDGIVDAIKAKTDNLPASPAAVGSAMTLEDDAITAAKFDQSTAHPLASADTGATAVARVGADSDTLETLSDQIDAAATAAELAKVPKSDGSATWNATALASINAEVDTALNTAIPGSPTSDSINERLKTLDDAYTAARGAYLDELAAANIPADIDTLKTGVGTAGDGLTAVPWNASWDAEVQSEVQDAIEANDLDHIAKANAPAAPEAGSWLGDLLEDDGGTWRFSANTLEEAPANSVTFSVYSILAAAVATGTPKIAIAALQNGEIVTSSTLSVTIKERVPGGTAVTRGTLTAASPSADYWYELNLGFTPTAGHVYTVTGTLTIDSASRDVACAFVMM